MSDDRERTDAEEREQAAALSRRIFIKMLSARAQLDTDHQTDSTAFVRAFVSQGYRLTDEEREWLGNIDDDLVEAYDDAVSGEYIDYDGPTLEELMRDE